LPVRVRVTRWTTKEYQCLAQWCTDGTTYELGTPVAAATNWRFAPTYLGTARTAQLADRVGALTPAIE